MLAHGEDGLRRGRSPVREPEVVRDKGAERDNLGALLEVEEEEREPLVERRAERVVVDQLQMMMRQDKRRR